MAKAERRIDIEEAQKILSDGEFNLSKEDVSISLDFLYELVELAMEQASHEQGFAFKHSFKF